jgi:hypothetical protein
MSISVKKKVDVKGKRVQPLSAESILEFALFEANVVFRDQILAFKAHELLTECK